MRTPEQQNLIDVTRGWGAQMLEAGKQLTDVARILEEQWPTGALWQLPFRDGETWPVSQPYGYDPSYEGNFEHFHYGIDYACPAGTEVVAVAAGTVVVARTSYPPAGAVPGVAMGAWGTYCEIDHGGGLHSGYAHLQALVAWPGQQVRAGQILGLSGETGLAFGPHLHLHALRGNERVDPTPLLG